MLDAVLHGLVEVVLYGKGYWTVRLLSGGRIDPGKWRESVVTLIGLLVTAAWCVPLLVWLGNRG